MLTRSFPRVERATVHPLSTGADDVVVGHEHVVEEHLVEHRRAGRFAQRTHLDAFGLHVDDDRGDAGVLRRVGVRAHGREPALAVLGAARPHLLAGDLPTAVDARRTRADAGRVGAGVGLAEELAPHVLPLERGPHPARDLILGGVLDQGEDDPAR